MRAVRAELKLLRRDLRLEVGEAMRRRESPPADPASARAIERRLAQSIKEARSITDRTEAASGQLQQRDTQLRTLGGTLKQVVRVLRGLLDRAHQVSSQSSRAERRARVMLERLVVQTWRSRQVANDLKGTAGRLAASDSTVRSDASTLEDSRPPGELVDGVRGDASISGGDRSRVRRLLQNTQTSLTELRNLARPDNGARPSGSVAEVMPTARLANKVEHLLEMIEPR